MTFPIFINNHIDRDSNSIFNFLRQNMNKILPINVGMLYFLFTIHAVKMELPYGINKSLLRHNYISEKNKMR